MFTRIAPALALWMLCCSAAYARQITWSCETVMDRTGEATYREVVVDTEQRTVSDNALKWHDGALRPLFSPLTEFVGIDGDQVSWGSRMTSGDEVLDLFSIHIPDGQYAWHDPKTGRISHGVCSGPALTS